MKTTTLEYLDGSVPCKGILAYEEAGNEERRPGILLVPDIRGVGLRPKAHVERLTSLGYVVLAADMYGNGTNMRDREHGTQLMGDVRSTNEGWRRRVSAGLDALKSQARVDVARVGAVGYCFGGATVLELALSGAEIAAAVVMHGSFEGVRLEDAANIKARILFCAGVDDPLLPTHKVVEMQESMRHARVSDWQVMTFGNTRHGFTNTEAQVNEVTAYNKVADQRALAAMVGLFKEAFE